MRKSEDASAVMQKKNMNLLITETWRTKDEQDALFAKDRTAPGSIVTNCKYSQSAHCWGVAFDFCRNIKGSEYTNEDGFFNIIGLLQHYNKWLKYIKMIKILKILHIF